MKPLISLFIIFSLFACQTSSNKKETKEFNEWVSLFNGESFDGWHLYNGGSPQIIFENINLPLKTF